MQFEKMTFDGEGGGGLIQLIVIYVAAVLGDLLLGFCLPVMLRTMKNTFFIEKLFLVWGCLDRILKIK